jgi:hypothetical protein
MRCGHGGAAARGRWGGRAVGLGRFFFFFFACRCMVPAFCEVAGGAWESAAAGTLQHGLWGARAGPVLAIRAGTMALIGAAAVEGVEWVVRSQPQGRSRSVDLATVWLHYDGGIAVFDAGSTGRGTGGGWGVDERVGAAEGGRQAAPKAEKAPFWEWAHPGIFGRWGHVTSPQNIFGWLFRHLCVTMVYGLGLGRLGASGGRYIVHNVHLCPNMAKSPNVRA